MPQNPESQSFIDRITQLPTGPGISLDDALQPSLDDEAELRKLWATDKTNARLSSPYVGLVDVFDAPDDIRTTRARVVNDGDDLSAKYVMPLSETNRRKEGAPSMVADLEEFQKNWAIFTEGSLSQLIDWNNVVAAGGSVLACLTPLSDTAKVSKRAIRKYYHSAAYPTSDVDLFLWGMTPEQAEVKINAIYEAVRDSVPWDVTCVRTKHTVSIHSQYPYRSVQIVLRLYSSPAEILAGFDIDAPCCAYDGTRVWANPRAIVAMMRQCNTVDMSRRSPSYEVRLAKYSGRAFEVYVPTLKREDIDPTIYERSIARMEGLARLLVFEKLTDTDTRYAFLESRRELRGRPNALNRYNRRNKRKYKGDLKGESAIGGLEMNDYDVASLHIPYGPGWDARRIDKLIYQTDLGMNSTFNPKNKGRRLHRHPAFFGTMRECLEDCCENCPEPIDDDEHKLQGEEDEQYIRSRLKFIEENPGRQSISGSFNPIDVGEWSDQVYVKQTEVFFAAIAAKNLDLVKSILASGTLDVNQRDHVGRTSLHVAIISRASDIACELINAGGRVSARLVDGKTPLHLAAQYNLVDVVKKLLERSAVNAEQVKKGDANKMDEDGDGDKGKKDLDRPSSEDDWSSDEDDGKEGDVVMKDAQDEDDGGDEDESDHDEGDDDEGDDGDEDEDGEAKKAKVKEEEKETAAATGDIPEDEEDQPDILDVNMEDWDFGFPALSYAILYASLPVLEVLITNGADVKAATKMNKHDASPLLPLTLTILREDEDEACKIAERLLQAGASSSTADQFMRTIFHMAVNAGKVKLVSTILKCDPNASSVVNFPAIKWNDVIFPLASAVKLGSYSIIAILLAHGAKVEFEEEDVTRAREAAGPKGCRNMLSYGITNFLQQAITPVETAMQSYDDVVQLLLALGAQASAGLKKSITAYDRNDRRSLLDWADFAIDYCTDTLEKLDTDIIDKKEVEDIPKTGWKGFRAKYEQALREPYKTDSEQESEEEAAEKRLREREERVQKLNDSKLYLVEAKRLLLARGAKTWSEIYPDKEGPIKVSKSDAAPVPYEADVTKESGYNLLSTSYYRQPVPVHLSRLYDELYEACFAGDKEKIKKLCLPSEGQQSKTSLLCISVDVRDPKQTNSYIHPGFTPLFVAVSGRQWSTAKLIIAIAAAQYHPDEEDDVNYSESIHFDDDSDDDASECSDDTVEMKTAVTKFKDVATLPFGIESDIHPKTMLQDCFVYCRGERCQVFTNLLQKAVHEKDFEAFVHLANLYHALPEPLELPENLLQVILNADLPEFLDEYIRRTGYGIDFKVAQQEAGDEVPVINDKNRIYLGLNVHGKKRADLATQNDPNAIGQAQNTVPLVWKAAQSGAKGIVEYLTTDKPLAAFRFYSTSNSESDRAERLRRTSDLDKVLPGWLGWTISPLGESPLTAAIMGNHLAVIKLLFAKKGSLMSSALKQSIKFVGYNPLLLAVLNNCDIELIDNLLGKSVSPAERDQIKGWNIYHFTSCGNNGDLVEHLLRKLPRDVNEALLTQQSKDRLNTPLHLAVKAGSIRVVQLILDLNKSSLLTRNIDGHIPLHCAVIHNYPEVLQLLINADSAGSSLRMEDGMGQTPYEIHSLRELTVRLQDFPATRDAGISEISPSHVQERKRYDMDKLQVEVPLLRSTIDALVKDSKLKDKTKLSWELNAFVTMMEVRLRTALDAENAASNTRKPVEPKNAVDRSDIHKLRKVLLAGLAAVGGSSRDRQLVHLIDVQRSVRANLEKVNHKKWQDVKDEGFGEDAGETQEHQRGIIFQLVGQSVLIPDNR